MSLFFYNFGFLNAKMLRIAVFIVLFVFYLSDAQYVGDSCVKKDGKSGKCKLISQCPVAIEEFKKKIFPTICSYVGAESVVCCVEAPATPPPPLVTTTRPRKPVTENIPVYDYVDNNGNSATSCAPLDASLTAPPTNSKAWNKCLEYQEKYVYPCDGGEDLLGSTSRAMNCHHQSDPLIIGGKPAAEHEFPHMVLLGYGDQLESAAWLCAGSLISDSFVLTAGHCTVSRNLGSVTFALMGVLRRSEGPSPQRARGIQRIISYPQYAPPNRYHDIALLELDAPVTLSQFLVPACLHVDTDPTNQTRAAATGWGLTTNKGEVSDILQNVVINKFPANECSELYPPHRHMKQGFDPNTQICYGDKKVSKDTCQGDSGGPLQLRSLKINCMYAVVGVTSFGKECGLVGQPGIYTRVAHYVDWIESVVWP